MSYSVLSLWIMPLLLLVSGLLATLADAQAPAQPVDLFQPGQPMLDTDGKPIVAMGGGFMIHGGVYYWFGEHKVSGGGAGHTQGVICYSSADLYRWKNEGYVLTGFGAQNGQLAKYPLGERPKVIYNEKTGKYVMWVHLEDARYAAAISGVAVADKPTGPYKIVNILHDYGDNRDMTIYQDDDGKAYHIFATDNNQFMAVTQLSDDYLTPNGKMVKCPFGGEAPAIFKHHGQYYMLRSECSGFDPNSSTYAIAESMLGNWRTVKDPAFGPNSAKTFMSQVTAVIPVIGQPDAFIFVADRWHEQQLELSTQFFLPITINGPGDIAVYWYDHWDLRYFKRHLSCQLTQRSNVNAKGESKIRLRLVNTGKSLEEGRVVLIADREPTGGALQHINYTFQLPSGATLQHDITLSFPIGLTTIQAYADPVAPSVHFGGELIMSHEYDVPRKPQLAHTGDITTALAAQPALTLTRDGNPLAHLCLAVAGENLAVYATLLDHGITPATAAPWKDSGLELYFSLPGETDVRQVIFYPTAPRQYSTAQMYQNGAQLADASFPWEITTRPDYGYDFAALIPLSLLHIDASKPFRFEMAAITRQQPNDKSQFITLGGSVNAFMWNKRFWTARVK